MAVVQIISSYEESVPVCGSLVADACHVASKMCGTQKGLLSGG